MSDPILDDVNKLIIEKLQRDGRMSYAALAKVVGLSEAAVRQRVQRLLDTGVMQIVAVTDPLTLGFARQVMVGLKVEGDMRSVADALSKIPEVDYVVICAGALRPAGRAGLHRRRPPADPAQRQDPHDLGRHRNRDLRLPQTDQANLRMGYPMNDDELATAARDHLWMHFTRLSAYADAPVPVIVRGDGRVRLRHQRQALPGRALRAVRGAGRARPPRAGRGRRQAGAELAYFPLWSYAHPKAVELADRLADLAPGDLNRVFFTTGGSEAVESGLEAGPLLLQAHRQADQAQGDLAVTSPTTAPPWARCRSPACPAIKADFEPLVPSGIRVPNTNFYRAPAGTAGPDGTEPRRSARGPPTGSRRPSCSRGRTPSPRSSSSRCRTPAAASRRRPATSSGSGRSATRYDVLLVSDEVICAFGRLGEYFGAERYGYQPDIITCAKGLTSGYVPLGAMIASDRLAEPFLHGTNWFAHGVTFGGHPVACRGGAGQPRHLRARGPDRARAGERGAFRSYLERLQRPADRRRRPRRRLLLRHRAGQGQGDPGDLQRRRVRAAAARLPVQGAVRRRALLPRRRPRRPGRPARAAADLRRDALRRDRADPARRCSPRRGRSSETVRRPTATGAVLLDVQCGRRPRPRGRRLPGDLDVDVADRRRRLHRAVDGVLPGPGRPAAADRGRSRREIAGYGASGRNGGWCSALFPQSLGGARPPARAERGRGRPAPAPWRPQSTRSAGSPRPRASTATSPRAARSCWPAPRSSSPGPAPRSPRPGSASTWTLLTPPQAARSVRRHRRARRDVHAALRGASTRPSWSAAWPARWSGAGVRSYERTRCTAIAAGRPWSPTRGHGPGRRRGPGDRGLHRRRCRASAGRWRRCTR